ncbi:MAG TPA: hypothetical protein DEA96_03290 [Leptospiraceae bacterium]|nr:hypothetical protein [Spirochaetaceae bacterium]HBS03964.1 hypothetical protein [Leptospiraceae bacterium]|tara:strand:+ start:248 stop:559 length:312 start_codon:yes stop_codon:yes gene_type:complete
MENKTQAEDIQQSEPGNPELPAEDTEQETESTEGVPPDPEPEPEKESEQAASYASVLADHISSLDDFIQQRLWSKIQSYATQKLPPATALNLAVRAIEAELRN